MNRRTLALVLSFGAPALLAALSLVAAPGARAAPEDEPAAAPATEPECTWEVLATGEGEACGEGRAAVVHYVGTLQDGTRFDSSRERGRAFTFEVGAGNVIKGWDATVAKMRVGDRWKVTIPWQLAYGERGAPPKIPARADLVFDIELLAVTDITTEAIAEGDGRRLAPGDFAEAHITLSVADGETLTDTRAQGEPGMLSVGRPTGVAGLDMGLRRMSVGDHWRITIPPALAFGEKGAPPKVPANATVIAEVHVLRVFEPQIETLEPGEGPTPEPGQRVRVHYTGTLTDGAKFDSSRDRDQPFSFVVGAGQVIPGWDMTLRQMRVGQRVRTTIPWQLAYGASGRPPVIPAKADLVFDIELLAIE